jgi:hypothetical protein
MMFSIAIPGDLAAQLEAADANAWRDMYAAAPAAFARRFQLEMLQVDDVVLTRCPGIPFVHFNCVLNLGMHAPATERQLDTILARYHAAGVRGFAIYATPLCQPAELPGWLAARGLRVRGGWERIYRDDRAPAELGLDLPARVGIEQVGGETAGEWAAYLDTSYGLPTAPWLLALVGRPGWHHYMLRVDGRIGAVRSMYLHRDGMAWLGIDAPVPGIMAPSFDLDAQLCQRMIRDGLRMGARYFVADIEAPTPEMDTPAYRYFEALGFQRPYFRGHYGY